MVRQRVTGVPCPTPLGGEAPRGGRYGVLAGERCLKAGEGSAQSPGVFCFEFQISQVLGNEIKFAVREPLGLR